jgi:hypothetical protein
MKKSPVDTGDFCCSDFPDCHSAIRQLAEADRNDRSIPHFLQSVYGLTPVL